MRAGKTSERGRERHQRERERDRRQVTSPYVQHEELLRERGGTRSICCSAMVEVWIPVSYPLLNVFGCPCDWGMRDEGQGFRVEFAGLGIELVIPAVEGTDL